ncbi:MAG: YggT family protein, partial [Gammaproteobacteria bacterium]|nr:YggT family protein [Gammaproteobacteria bacterium]
YIAIVLLRFLLQMVGADFYNPISQFIVKATQKPVVIARRIIPSVRGLDIATLTLALLLIFIETGILQTLGTYSSSAISLVFWSIHNFIQLIFNVFIFAIFIQALLSWVNPDPYNPVSAILGNLTWPVLRHVKKLIPPTGGFDFSPIIALIGLTFIKLSVLYVLNMFFRGIG